MAKKEKAEGKKKILGGGQSSDMGRRYRGGEGKRHPTCQGVRRLAE